MDIFEQFITIKYNITKIIESLNRILFRKIKQL